MHYDYFIASRYRNKSEVLRLARMLREKGKSLYCFIESEASLKHVGSLKEDPEKQMKKYEAKENWREDPAIQEIFESDMNALKNSRTLIMLLPAGKSVHIEAGVAYGLGKHLVLIGEQAETESLYFIFNEMYSTIESFLASF